MPGEPLATFEVGVFNARVRELVGQGKRHKHLADSWADIHYLEVEARDEEAARRKVAGKYPGDRGYVIVSVERLRY